MFVYFLLLSVTAFFAYTIGSISTRRLASRFVFHRNLFRLGTGNLWLSNFRRLFGIPGFIKLTLVELVKDLLPVLLGGLLLSLKGHADVGRAFAGFCVVLARLWPVFNRFSGCRGCVGMCAAALLVDPSVAIATAVVCASVVWFSRYIALGAVLGAGLMIVTSVLVVENRLCMLLLIAAAAAVIVRSLPTLVGILRGEEERLSFKTDLTYKLDEKF